MNRVFLMNRVFDARLGFLFLIFCTVCVPVCFAQGTVPVEEASPALTPAEAVKRFKVPEDLGIRLVAAEPQVSQPLSISFDDRGRMWVLQYLQFPKPNGLKPVKVDNYLRTEYDKIPEPPPKGPKGKDRISIYEDTNGDGQADKVKHFVSDLNLASGMALGHGGVFIAQPPYLLFYPDKNKDDIPDGDPEVLLKGFGMNDSHAFANSLTWGPDGWLFGAQGSTATANIRGIGFQQGIWRYHPLTKEFELFAEGGGNTWGIDFDQYGNLFAAGNTVEPLVHHVQGAYYVKGFGKHGPLHNPHTYGYFQPVKHHGYAGDSLTGGFVLYQGGAFPKRFDGQCIAPNTRHSATRWSTVETRGTTFATRAAGDFITTNDIWFRPVDSTVGPDGALYVADWYDYSISHSSPKNRSKWYEPSRFDGRVWRVAPENIETIRPGAIDLNKKSSRELVSLLSHSNAWYARQSRRLLAERRDRSVIPLLEKMLDGDSQRLSLQALWSIYVSGGFDSRIAAKTLASSHEYVRAWTVRLLGDSRSVTPTVQAQFVKMALDDSSAIVRSQLACTAKRLPADTAVPIIAELLKHDEDIDDIHIPLLLWWAIEDKSISDTQIVLQLVDSPEKWQQPLMQKVILERLAQRLASAGTDTSFAACAKLFEIAPTDGDIDLILSGVLKALSGRKFDAVPAPMKMTLARLLKSRGSDVKVIQLALRLGSQQAQAEAVKIINQADRNSVERIVLINTLGETRNVETVDVMLKLIGRSEPIAIHSAALSALGYFGDETIGTAVLLAYPKLGGARARAIEFLCSRQQWAVQLLAAVGKKQIDPKAVPLTQLRQLSELGDKQINKLVAKHWGRIQAATPLEKQGRISAISQMLGRKRGDAVLGMQIFEKTCANCHKLHGKGKTIGPDLTGAERKDRKKLVFNLVDPNAAIRQQYISYVAVTTDGRVLTGLLADSTPETVSILDAKNKRTRLNRKDIEELRESTVSLMPEKLLEPFTDQQIRDLFAYLQSDRIPELKTSK